MDQISLLSNFLNDYEGRDKFLRLFSYTAKFACGVTSGRTAGNLKKVSSEMSNCRVVLRLMDDIPAWHDALSYEWTRKQSKLIDYVSAIQTVIDVIYSPIESICWAGGHRILSINTELWDTTTTYFWITSISLSLIKSAYKIIELNKYKQCLNDKSNNRIQRNKIKVQQRSELVTCIRLILDFSYAVSYLPKGTLYGGKLKTWQVGALGTLSSLIAIYQALNKRAKSS
ncbi:peroxisomal membrane protein 11C-like [Leptopilina heterotoma]|uniref:peroxisomal membrane protein 11C-like n=1 Tax=Leptopilina heterotoma TaxID=63436 RepID=UPI001CA8C476|nr:peroxisomal membrane protein 11C-like [Leptopilina heterotoma]